MEKLIRDTIPTIAKNKGELIYTRFAQSNEEYIDFLLRKIYEELAEFDSAYGEEKVLEACDVMEVYDTIIGAYFEGKNTLKAREFKQAQKIFIDMCIDVYKMAVHRILEEQVKKKTLKGGFKKGIIGIF